MHIILLKDVVTVWIENSNSFYSAGATKCTVSLGCEEDISVYHLHKYQTIYCIVYVDYVTKG